MTDAWVVWRWSKFVLHDTISSFLSSVPIIHGQMVISRKLVIRHLWTGCTKSNLRTRVEGRMEGKKKKKEHNYWRVIDRSLSVWGCTWCRLGRRWDGWVWDSRSSCTLHQLYPRGQLFGGKDMDTRQAWCTGYIQHGGAVQHNGHHQLTMIVAAVRIQYICRVVHFLSSCGSIVTVWWGSNFNIMM